MRKLIVFFILIVSGCSTIPKVQNEVKNYGYFSNRIFTDIVYDAEVLVISGYQLEKRMITSDRLTIYLKFIKEGVEFNFIKNNLYLEDKNGNKYYVGIMGLPEKINTTTDNPSFTGKVVIKVPNLDHKRLWLYEEANGKKYLISFFNKFDKNMIFPGFDNGYVGYEIAKKLDTIEAYNGFINGYPSSEKKDEAQEKIYTIGFNKAKSNGTIEAYNNFIFKYRDAGQVIEAKKQIKKIEQHYDFAKHSNSVAAYKLFKRQHPKSNFNSVLLRNLKDRCKNKKNYHTCYDLYKYLDDFKYLKYASQLTNNKKIKHEYYSKLEYQEILINPKKYLTVKLKNASTLKSLSSAGDIGSSASEIKKMKFKVYVTSSAKYAKVNAKVTVKLDTETKWSRTETFSLGNILSTVFTGQPNTERGTDYNTYKKSMKIRNILPNRTTSGKIIDVTSLEDSDRTGILGTGTNKVKITGIKTSIEVLM